MTARYRWRTWLRRPLPHSLVQRGFVPKGKRDCGGHGWYNADGLVERCYHCEAGVRPYHARHFTTP